MASENYLEDALNAEVDEKAVNAIMKSLEIQLDSTVMRDPNLERMSGDVIKSSRKVERANNNPEGIHIITHPEPNFMGSHYDCTKNVSSLIRERNKTDISRTINPSTINLSYIQSINCAVPARPHNQSNTVPVKFQENVKPVFCAGNQVPGNKITFQQGLLPNRNLGHSLVTPQSLLKMPNAMPNVLNVSEPQTPSQSPVMIQFANIPGIEHMKSEGRNVMFRGNGNNLTPGPPLLMSVVPVPMTADNIGNASNSHVTVNTSSPNISGVISLPKPNAPTVGISPTIERNSSTTICPPNLQIVNVIPLRPDAPVKQDPKNIPSRMVIGTPQLTGSRPGPSNIMPVSTHKSQGGAPTQGHLLLKAQNGQFQWVRVNLATAKPGIAVPSSSKTPTTPGPSIVTKTITPNVTNRQQPSPANLLPQNAKNQFIVDNNCKDKCHKFLSKILELAANESDMIRKSILDLIQDLIDAKVEPDYFCRCLEVLLNSKSTNCLVDFLKRSLPAFRIALITKELMLEGVRPPLYQLGLPPSPAVMVPQLQSIPSAHSMQSSSHQQSILIQRHTDTGALLKPQDLVWQSQMRSQLQPKSNNVPLQMAGQVNLMSGNMSNNMLNHGNNQTSYNQPILRPQGTAIRSAPTRILRPQPTIALPTPSIPAKKTSSDPILKCTSPTVPLEINQTFVPSNIPDVNKLGNINQCSSKIKDDHSEIDGMDDNLNTNKSSTDKAFLDLQSLQDRINKIALAHGLSESNPEVVTFISHACRERMRSILKKLSFVAGHRAFKFHNAVPNDVSRGVQGQLKFLEEVDKLKSKNQENVESKFDMSDQARLKAKYKRGLKAEMKELRQQEANQTALQAIGFRKKAKLENENDNFNLLSNKNITGQNPRRILDPVRRLKRVTLKDLIWCLEDENHVLSRKLLYKAYHNW